MENLKLDIIDSGLSEAGSFYKFASDWFGLINAHKKEEPKKKEPWTTIDLRPIKEKWHEMPMGKLTFPIEFEGVSETITLTIEKTSEEFPYKGDELALYLEPSLDNEDEDPMTITFKAEYVEL